ncbi:putative tyrosine protein phosphatase OCA1 KNAG_0I01950 [Huiozyma naganishii CBS 8797]|uniref:Putative tyrosine-protein phosphatase OCA1 n=1 Tax=Huiozyma naganishii (strain ATCC MYA-139 / BCRC 22969 / CBS 8797 / KCTC 17520 / NBRC 10181 / NCYC 3082 / Yp74L-3) TaxID=1071383 RepID=J7RAU8_HUIN7|nr:hypothetical protein KNAG_0I01950 [Kazachstania naganishii CBS 8797]CCK71980.1 hypothetical protein KNAG_0I01950 [Kazachstania naganishii CBS 8797]
MNSVIGTLEKSRLEDDDVDDVEDEEEEDDNNAYINEETEIGAEQVLISHAPAERIVPPLNFCPVERFLYRSGQPSPVNFPFLLNLNLKTIIWLANEEPQDNFIEFCDANQIGLQFAAINPDGGEDDNPWDGLTEHSIINALKTIVCDEHYPLLVCCGMGRHRTGTVVGCLRRIMGWNLASVSEEYRRFTGSRGGRSSSSCSSRPSTRTWLQLTGTEHPSGCSRRCDKYQ